MRGSKVASAAKATTSRRTSSRERKMALQQDVSIISISTDILVQFDIWISFYCSFCC